MPLTIIISSGINSGKTTFLEKILRLLRERRFRVSGFLSRKKTSGGARKYYLEIIGLKERLKAVETGGAGLRAFPGAFRTAEKNVFRKMSASDFILMDEAGRLEIGGKGHSRLLKKLLKGFAGILVIVVRKELLDGVISVFGIKRAKVIKKLSIRNFMKKAGL